MDRPEGLGAGGTTLWDSIAGAHALDAMQVVQLTEACRMKDRLDQLDRLLRGDVSAWAEIVDRDGFPSTLVINGALDKANTTANTTTSPTETKSPTSDRPDVMTRPPSRSPGHIRPDLRLQPSLR